MTAYDHKSVLDVSWNEDGDELDWNVTGWPTAFSASLSRHPYIVRKLEYHMSQFADASGDQKKLLKIVAKVLNTDNDTPFPPCDSFDTLAEQFSDLFSEKIAKIRSALIHDINIIDNYTDGEPQTCLLTAFEPGTETDIGFDAEMTMESHMTAVCTSAIFTSATSRGSDGI
ncbi:hypothetical protein NP493_218g03040 [Ridgeia piscesae]|uniref:Uncharacterized protein n=1 Tax=Ridgeia piscesae TaxID=27915 RepID=A0AAD9P0L7_RIDPI|nr:hypothetical protein NP493_218g03040 [Ridgeia piscesae]